jgi:hypothetical protein
MKLRHRIAAAAFFLGLPSITSAANEVLVHRYPGCGCCEKWAQMVRAKFGRNVVVRDDRARAEFRRRAGVPVNLVSCTLRSMMAWCSKGMSLSRICSLVRIRPVGVKGLAVAGMPIGSDGMEAPGAPRQPYNVIAFGPSGTRVFSRHLRALALPEGARALSHSNRPTRAKHCW